MEKKRRARINTCLEELKEMLLLNQSLWAPAAKVLYTPSFPPLQKVSMFTTIVCFQRSNKPSKLEKADILELTVRAVKALQERHQAKRQEAATEVAAVTMRFEAGFRECMREVEISPGRFTFPSASTFYQTTFLKCFRYFRDRTKDSRTSNDPSDISYWKTEISVNAKYSFATAKSTYRREPFSTIVPSIPNTSFRTSFFNFAGTCANSAPKGSSIDEKAPQWRNESEESSFRCWKRRTAFSGLETMVNCCFRGFSFSVIDWFSARCDFYSVPSCKSLFSCLLQVKSNPQTRFANSSGTQTTHDSLLLHWNYYYLWNSTLLVLLHTLMFLY